MDSQLAAWFATLPLPVRGGLIALIAVLVALVTLTDLTFAVMLGAWQMVAAGAVGIAAVAGAGWWFYHKTQREKQETINAKLAREGQAALVLPLRGVGERWSKASKYAETFGASLATLTRQMPDKHLSLEIIGTEGGIYLQIWAPDLPAQQGLVQNLLASFPNLIQIRPPESTLRRRDVLEDLLPQTQWATFELSQDAAYPLRQIADFNTESLPSILAALMRQPEMGRIGFQIVLKAPSSGWKRKATRNAAQKRQSLAEQRNSLRATGEREELKRLEAKADALTGSACTIRAFAEPQSADRLKRMVSAVASMTRSRYNGLEVAGKGQGADAVLGRYFDYDARKVVLSAEELAPLWHVPADNKGVVTARGVQIPPPAEVITVDRPPFHPDHRILGRGMMDTGEQVFVKWKHGFDTRVHSFSVGPTGSGKSTLMLFLMLQDICSGYGTILMEPHRDLTLNVIDNLPPERARDVAWINPTDPKIKTLPSHLGIEPWDLERTFGLNMLDYGGEPERIQGATRRFMFVVQMMLGGRTWDQMPRMKRILDSSLGAIMEGVEGTPTLMHLWRLIDAEQSEYRDSLIERVKNPMVKTFWTSEYESWNSGRKAEAFGPVRNRIQPLIQHRIVRHIVAQEHTTLPFLKLMDAGKVILIDLSANDERISEASGALGTMMITLLWAAAKSRVKHTYPVATYLWVDEFHNYVTRQFEQILAEARGFGLGVNAATQSYEQVPDFMQEALEANAWTKLTAALKSRSDARRMEKILDVPSEQLRTMEKYTWAAQVSADRQTTDTFTVRSLPPVKLPSETEKGEVYLDASKLHESFRRAGNGEMPHPEDRGGESFDAFEGVGDLDAGDEAAWKKHREAMRGKDLDGRAEYLEDLSEDAWQTYRRLRQMMDKRWYQEIVSSPDGFDDRRDWIRTMSALQLETPRDEIEAERLRLAGEAADVVSDLADLF